MTEIKAVFFDQDGVIIDTERDGHRVSFNETFQEFGFDVVWDVDTYHELLQVGGGKERMKHHLHTRGFGRLVPPEQEDELIRAMHKRKTEIFIQHIERGELPLRPGVKRFMREVNQAGLVLGICTTSNERAAAAIVNTALHEIKFDLVLAGDIVAHKKPDPEIYHLARQQAGVEPQECLVIEDSHNGVTAAKAAGMHVIATTNPYTEQEDLSQADIILTCLGEPGGEQGQLRKGCPRLPFDGVLTLAAALACFRS